MIFNLYPNNLYKYRQLDDNARVMLSGNIIYFTSPSKFNDPFDCSIPFRFDYATRDQIIQYYYEHYKKENPKEKDPTLRKMAKDFYKSRKHENPEAIKQFNLQVINFQKSHGIFSLTPNYNSLLMWSHYANAHKGFCIGFNVYKLLSHSSKCLYKKRGFQIALFEVLYSSEYPKINIFDPTQMDKLPSITTKSKVWSYEQEYRLILLNKANHVEELPKGIIKRVILGYQISTKDKEEIIDILKNKNNEVHLWQAKLLEDKYGLAFEYVNYKK